MDKVVKSLFRTLLVCGILTVGFSVTSISSQAAGNQSEAQVNADINGGVENSEEYQQILADIAKLEEEIAGYEKALEQVKSDYEFFLMRVGLEEDFVETYEGYEKAKSELMDKFGKLHEREFELEEKYEELKIKYRELFASENADEAELQALQDEMDIIDAERKEISKRLDEVYEEYERISDIEDYVTRGLNIDEYYRYIQTYRDQIEGYQNSIDWAKSELDSLYTRKAELKQQGGSGDEPIEVPSDTPTETPTESIIYTDETFEFEYYMEESLLIKIHYVGQVRNQPNVARLLNSIDAEDSYDNIMSIVEKIAADLNGLVTVEVSNASGIVFSDEIELSFTN